jgi:hypothetical protein
VDVAKTRVRRRGERIGWEVGELAVCRIMASHVSFKVGEVPKAAVCHCLGGTACTEYITFMHLSTQQGFFFFLIIIIIIKTR